jgi:hypothetical protein
VYKEERRVGGWKGYQGGMEGGLGGWEGETVNGGRLNPVLLYIDLYILLDVPAERG